MLTLHISYNIHNTRNTYNTHNIQYNINYISMSSAKSSSNVPHRQPWSEVEPQSIQTYAKQNPSSHGDIFIRWFEFENPSKELTQSPR
ncbi:hypothetical protein BGX38DRAFT_280881 [Terfezia claveryi]|nr:hypothetical protein BGX38DRAFT_280881 [Terfezia claveryi]